MTIRQITILYSLLIMCNFMLEKPLQAASPPGLERLFTTAEQRKELDRMRREGVGAGQRIESDAVATNVSRVKIDGIVVGSDGRRSLWVNGRATPTESVLTGTGVRVRLVDNDRVAVKPAKQRRAVLLKPGQVLELGSGSIHESYEIRADSQTPANRGDHAR